MILGLRGYFWRDNARFGGKWRISYEKMQDFWVNGVIFEGKCMMMGLNGRFPKRNCVFIRLNGRFWKGKFTTFG